jgi:hypothetical protein
MDSWRRSTLPTKKGDTAMCKLLSYLIGKPGSYLMTRPRSQDVQLLDGVQPASGDGLE